MDEDSNETSSISYVYDDDRLLTGVGDLSLSRNLVSGLIEEVTLGDIIEEYNYDVDFAELAGFEAKHLTTNILAQDYVRDALGRINEVEETVGVTSNIYSYEYDLRGRLIKAFKDSALERHYFYDENSNRLKIEDGSANILVTATYDNQDRVTSYGDYTFTYTDYGHRNEKLNTSTNIKESLVYDSMGALVSYIKEDTSTSTTLTEIEYTNDGLGRRILKTKNSIPEKRYIYDGGIRLIGEVTPDGDTLTHYVYADKDHVPSYMIRGTDKYKLITNAQGSVRFVVNDATGTIEQEITYDEFGQILTDSSPGFQAFGFAGGIYDPDTKLTRFGARDYDAETGRWLSKDPILFNGGDTNLYGYTFNDPVNFIDPEGEIAWFLPAMVFMGLMLNPLEIENPNASRNRAISDVVTIASGGLCKASGPAGPLFGRARYRGGQSGIFNRGDFRMGWSWDANKGRNMFGVHGGTPGTPGHWHQTPIPGPKGPSW